jgi:hypothetical protein
MVRNQSRKRNKKKKKLGAKVEISAPEGKRPC